MRLLYGIENNAKSSSADLSNEEIEKIEKKSFSEKLRNEVKDSEKFLMKTFEETKNRVFEAEKMEIFQKSEDDQKYKVLDIDILQKIQESPHKKSFTAKIRDDIQKSDAYDRVSEIKPPVSQKIIVSPSTIIENPLKPLENPLKPLENPLKPLENPLKPLENPLKPLETLLKPSENPLNSTKPIKKLESPPKSSKFSSICKQTDLETIEESLNQETIDGLLQWVEELPEELSSQFTNSKGFIL